MLKNKKAFTLAEIVITVAIIGTIAGLTIQTYFMDSNSQKNQFVAGLKKVYAEFNYATQQIKANNSGTLVGLFTDSNAITTQYCRYMKCSKTCSSGTAVSNGCFHAQADMKTLNDLAFGDDPTTASYRSFVLSDGTLVLTDFTSSDCSGSIDGVNSICGWFHVDINGFKAPNRTGRDIFTFWIRNSEIYLPGSNASDTNSDYSTYCNPVSAAGNDGLGCTSRVLKEGNMDY